MAFGVSVLSRDVSIHALVFAADCMHGSFGRRTAALLFVHLQKFSYCELVQHENRIHYLGSHPTFAAICAKVRPTDIRDWGRYFAMNLKRARPSAP